MFHPQKFHFWVFLWISLFFQSLRLWSYPCCLPLFYSPFSSQAVTGIFCIWQFILISTNPRPKWNLIASCFRTVVSSELIFSTFFVYHTNLASRANNTCKIAVNKKWYKIKKAYQYVNDMLCCTLYLTKKRYLVVLFTTLFPWSGTMLWWTDSELVPKWSLPHHIDVFV